MLTFFCTIWVFTSNIAVWPSKTLFFKERDNASFLKKGSFAFHATGKRGSDKFQGTFVFHLNLLIL